MSTDRFTSNRDALVRGLAMAMKKEEAARVRFAKVSPSSWKAKNTAENRVLDARRARIAAEEALLALDARPLREHGLNLEERHAMRTLLSAKGFDPREAERLQAEGMGPGELEGRLRHAAGTVGSLDYTHNLQRITPPRPAASVERANEAADRAARASKAAGTRRGEDGYEGHREAAYVHQVAAARYAELPKSGASKKAEAYHVKQALEHLAYIPARFR